MRIKDIKRYFVEQESLPKEKKERDAWFEMKDFLKFLVNSQDEMVPIYFDNNSWRSFFVYSLIVPEDRLKGNYINDLMQWNNSIISHGYGYGYSSSKEGYKPFLSEPMDSCNPKILNGSIPVFFLRNCYNHTSRIVEINQKISHVLEICWSERRNAFCKLNDVGDYVEIATIDDEDKFTLCTLKKEDLDFYLYLSKSVLIRFYDVMRKKDPSKSQCDKRQRLTLEDPKNEVYASLDVEKMDNGEFNFSWLLGFQIIRNKVPDEKMMKRLRNIEEREYESFIIHDFKNDRIIEWSSDPEELANYFIESDKPFETSPAFFNPEVLSKYKHNPDKYTVNSQSIECRGSWGLNYIDVNEEGQVFAFIYQLSRLPYSEQKYWKSFNEEPKAGISKRAYERYFEGKWDTDYDPLISLKNILETFPDAKLGEETVPIWKMPKIPSTRSIDTLNYVLSDSTKEWEDQISVLYQILIEGLQAKSIKLIANNLKCNEKGLGSVKQIAKCMGKLDVPEEDINTIVSPLFELIYLRKIVVHTIDEEYPDEDLKIHYRNLLTKCDKSMRKLADYINEDLFNTAEGK